MASRNAEKQHRYRQRLQERGLVHVQGWVTPAQAEAIRQIMAERGEDEPPVAPASRCGVTPRAAQRAMQNDPESS